ncbi:hypothetical protein POM88_042097 [Heracleum sosnowskyi]|uniref:Uncharacterized protein n=1 Tax=Heracleum sosnowskyi TaxID=360622 RepID=A0AAD8HHD2_9APIA|nr:hypothetical protein POM88_042097 [Heracleum sosnowskyi]
MANSTSTMQLVYSSIIQNQFDTSVEFQFKSDTVHGNPATVFAKLTSPTHNARGFSEMDIYAFIVPIRDMKTQQTLSGVEIQDRGHKVGLNGVDNGAPRFRASSLSFVTDVSLNPGALLLIAPNLSKEHLRRGIECNPDSGLIFKDFTKDNSFYLAELDSFHDYTAKEIGDPL